MCAAGRLRWSSLSGSLWWRRGPTTVTLPASPVPKQVNGAGTGLREDDEGEDLIHIGLSFPGGDYEYIIERTSLVFLVTLQRNMYCITSCEDTPSLSLIILIHVNPLKSQCH